MRRPREKLTYANVVSTLCLFLLLGGGAAFAADKLGKNSVGAKQIKNGAITTAKIRAGAVTGAKIKLSTLGSVPSASNADQLGGQPPSTYRDRCPVGTIAATASLCVRTAAFSADYVAAAAACAKLGFRLPSPSEAFLIAAKVTGPDEYLTDNFWTETGAGRVLIFDKGEEGLYGVLSDSARTAYCVTDASDS